MSYLNKNHGIFKYDINVLCSYISYHTDTPIHHTKQKPQITYIDTYFSQYKKDNIFFVYESEYVEQHFIEDYSEYYSRCFERYNKKCSRIHFFKRPESSKNLNDVLKSALLEGDKSVINNDNYIGFIVIRPIPQTFLAKVCLKVSDEDKLKTILKTKYNVCLFGIRLVLNTVAWQEQDKVLSACATSSLWSFLNAHPDVPSSRIPSPSTITKTAYPEDNGYTREFPNSGLSSEMMCRSLRNASLSPRCFEFSSESVSDKELFKEHVFVYCSSGLPLILGVCVKDENGDEKGLHAITIVGFKLNDSDMKSDGDSIKTLAHRMSSIYVHDDRYGAFVELFFSDNWYFDINIQNHGEVTTEEAFDPERYYPETLIVGTYHKVRISYNTIKDTCKCLVNIITNWMRFKDLTPELISLIKNLTWKIEIKEVSKLKNDILTKEYFPDKERYLTSSWPKYIWSAKASVGKDNIDVFELLFDATGIEQGHLFLDLLPVELDSYSAFVKVLKEYCSDKHYFRVAKDSFTRNPNNNIWSIIRFFRKRESYLDSLDDLFGPLKFPKLIKREEVDQDAIIVNEGFFRINDHCHNHKLEVLTQDEKYIWVIDHDGFLCVGKEKNGASKGHPTLTNGMPARIGGELVYESSEDIWEVNSFSGRYSDEYSPVDKKRLVENAIKYKFEQFFCDKKFRIKPYKQK